MSETPSLDPYTIFGSANCFQVIQASICPISNPFRYLVTFHFVVSYCFSFCPLLIISINSWQSISPSPFSSTPSNKVLISFSVKVKSGLCRHNFNSSFVMVPLPSLSKQRKAYLSEDSLRQSQLSIQAAMNSVQSISPFQLLSIIIIARFMSLRSSFISGHSCIPVISSSIVSCPSPFTSIFVKALRRAII